MTFRGSGRGREGGREGVGKGSGVSNAATMAWYSLHKVSQLVIWCFEPSQPLGIISGLKETFIKRYVVERTNKAEIRPGEQGKKKGELLGEVMEKGP